jgi:hypothetical protein
VGAEGNGGGDSGLGKRSIMSRFCICTPAIYYQDDSRDDKNDDAEPKITLGFTTETGFIDLSLQSS